MNLLQLLGAIIHFIVAFVFFTVMSVVFRFWGLIKKLLGLKGRSSVHGSRSSSRQQTNHYSDTYTKTTHAPSDAPQRKKIIPEDEGEYVDFEEV